MRKTYVIALRDYLAAVRTKSFLITVVLMPILMSGTLVIGRFSTIFSDRSPKVVGVIDRTVGTVAPNERPLYQVLIDAAQERDKKIFNEETGRYSEAPFELRPVPIGADVSPERLDEIRFEESEKVRRGEQFAFIEIGPRIIDSPPEELMKGAAGLFSPTPDSGDTAPPDDAEATPDPAATKKFLDEHGIRYSSENTTYMDLQSWVTKVLTPEIYARRIRTAGVPADKIVQFLIPPMANQRAMALKSASGEIYYEDDPNIILNLVLPITLLFLMFAVVMTAAQPLTTNVIEEKQLRIAEVLLGSVRPFELMLGKLIGTVGVSLTLAGIYATGGMFLASQFDLLDAIPPSTLVWFLVFAGLGTLMYGSLFVAVGAAVTNLKEAQNLLTPVIMLICAPLFVFMPILQDPDGPLARAFTWFPLTTPMTAVLRVAIPPGISTTDKFLAAGICLVGTLLLIWIAGRVFRFGMLHTDKAAAMKDMARWVIRG